MTDFAVFCPPALFTTWFRTMWFVPVYTLSALLLPFLLWLVLKVGFRKISAVADITAKTVMQQPIFVILAIFGTIAILAFPFIPYNTLGEDIKILKSQGMTLIRVLSILLAVWSAGTSISEEIEEKTALTLLSKPISRRQLVLGKFFGIILGVSIFFVILSTIFVPTCAYKVVHEARENCEMEPESIACLVSMVEVLPGLALSFMGVTIMTAVAVALSTRMSMIPNMTISVSIYALGHLVPLVVQSGMGRFAIVSFVGNFLAAILPGLYHFSLETAVGGGEVLPPIYLVYAGIYCLLYTTVAMFVALILFEDRDLA